jgi:hypothetical protein
MLVVIKVKLPKPRNPIAASIGRNNTKPKVFKDKTQYSRKQKHKGSF